jgi:hypothetical protein
LKWVQGIGFASVGIGNPSAQSLASDNPKPKAESIEGD